MNAGREAGRQARKGDKRTLLFGPVVNQTGQNYVSLAGTSARWVLAKAPTSTGADILLTKTTASSEGVSIVSEDWYGVPRYTVRVDLVKADTVGLPASMPPGKWWHSCEYIDGNGESVTISEGWFELQPSILNQ